MMAVDSHYTAEQKTTRRQHITIKFQEGPIYGSQDEKGVITEQPNGCDIEDVIDVLVERLRGFQNGSLRCRENALAITHLEEAGNWLVKRRMNRIAQGVEGTYQPHEEA